MKKYSSSFLAPALFAATLLTQAFAADAQPQELQLPRRLPAPRDIPDPLRPSPRDLTLPVVWGWADLHAHPAAHMSFGANDSGDGGIFWGKPGVALETSNPTAEMPPCNVDSHYGFDEDLVRKETRRSVISMVDGLTGWTHGAGGAPGFASWPDSQSIIHQQMHVQAIRRAYDGGLRLLIASTTDSQLLTNLWTKVGFNLAGNAVPAVDQGFDLGSAKRQLDFINRLVAANAGWMRIATTPSEARQAISENKLAVILSVEFDSLTAAQILELVQSYKVRHVIPIHLSDNTFGGAAVYSDVFNTANNYLNRSFFRVRTDPKLEIRLGRPSVLRSAEFGSIKPFPIGDSDFSTLGYTGGTGGHRNVRGLNIAEVLKLMRAGLLLDVAHMSEASADSALALSQLFRYPMMDSHTGLRDSSERALSERSLPRDHARRLAAQGGVMGLGTEGTSSDRELLRATGGPLIRFTGAVHEWVRPLPTAGGRVGNEVARLRLTIATGGDDLRGGGDNATAYLVLRSGARLTYSNVNQSQGWGGGVRRTVDLPLPAGTRIGDVISFGLVTAFRGGFDGDNWNVDEIRLVATEREVDTVATWLAEYKDAQSILGSGNVAFGTDINGFAPQMLFAAAPVDYPLSVARRFGGWGFPARHVAPLLPASTMGGRTYDFRRDGLAHYGLLADFLQALSQQPASENAVDSLFHSAEGVLRMWEKVEAAARNVH